MKKIFIVSSSIIALLIIVIFIVLAWHGMFSKPTIVEKEMGPYFYVYDNFTGDYSKTMPVFDTVYNKLQRAGIESTVGIGIYFDNPSEVPVEKLRSRCGSIVNLSDTTKISDEIFKKDLITRQKFAVIEFPIKSPLSYIIGPHKCYPVFTEYFKNKAYQTSEGIELYDMNKNICYYLMPVAE